MNFPDVLQAITTALNQAGIAYMLTGSFASAYYGLPRSSQDLDLVVEATTSQLRAFIESLPADKYYADLDAALEAHQHESMFNVIEMTSGWKIDVIIRKTRLFSREEFRRRRTLNLHGISLSVASPEDIIIAKLEWSKRAQSRRQIEDVAGILKIQGQTLDYAHLEKWIGELGLADEWADVQRSGDVS